MWREQPVVRTVVRAANGHVEQAVGVEVLWVYLGAGHRGEYLELVARQTAVIAVARETAAYDAAIINSSDELLFKRVDQALRTAHPLYPTVRLDRHLSSISLGRGPARNLTTA